METLARCEHPSSKRILNLIQISLSSSSNYSFGVFEAYENRTNILNNNFKVIFKRAFDKND